MLRAVANESQKQCKTLRSFILLLAGAQHRCAPFALHQTKKQTLKTNN
jgi:hypothetical protein